MLIETQQERKLYQSVLQSPDRLDPRLVYADWLEEHGDRRAGFLRLECELDGMTPDDVRFVFTRSELRRIVQQVSHDDEPDAGAMQPSQLTAWSSTHWIESVRLRYQFRIGGKQQSLAAQWRTPPGFDYVGWLRRLVDVGEEEARWCLENGVTRIGYGIDLDRVSAFRAEVERASLRSFPDDFSYDISRSASPYDPAFIPWPYWEPYGDGLAASPTEFEIRLKQVGVHRQQVIQLLRHSLRQSFKQAKSICDSPGEWAIHCEPQAAHEVIAFARRYQHLSDGEQPRFSIRPSWTAPLHGEP